MAIRPIKENTKDYVAAGTIGAIGGYATKWLLPLSEYEKDEFFTPAVKGHLEQVAETAGKQEYDTIILGAQEGSENISKSVLEGFKANEKSIVGNRFRDLLKNIKNYDDDTQKGIIRLSYRVREVGKQARKIESRPIEIQAKSSRPASYFILLGSIICLSYAVLKNALKKSLDTSNDYKSLDIDA